MARRTRPAVVALAVAALLVACSSGAAPAGGDGSGAAAGPGSADGPEAVTEAGADLAVVERDSGGEARAGGC